MKILFMGTGAADWNINERKENEFFRRLTAVRLNDDLMIDCSIEAIDFLEKNNASVDGVQNIIITHTHGDHYSPDAIAKLFGGKNVKIWAEERSVAKIERELPGFSVNGLRMFESADVGQYSVIAVPANHSVEDRNEQPVQYIISANDKTVFWGCDGGWINNLAWHEMRKHQFDLMVFDGTLGNAEGDYRIFEHNNLNMVREIAATARNVGIVNPDGKLMISHMSKYAHDEHGVLQKELDEVGIIVAFDGLETEF